MANIHVLEGTVGRSGGAAVYTAELLRRLSARGHRTDLGFIASRAALDRDCRCCGVGPLPSRSQLTGTP